MNFITQITSYIYPIVLEKRMGIYLPHIEVEVRKGKYQINGRKVSYSSGSLHDSFRQAFKQYRINEMPISNVLILGFGSGSIARILQEEFGLRCSITGVEVDSEMLELGEQYFHTGSYQNTQIHRADALDFIHLNTETYDLIVVDVFIEKRVPIAFLKSDFIRQVKQRLNPSGIVFFNRINDSIFHQEETTAFVKKLIVEWQGDVQQLNFKTNRIDNFILVYHNNSVEQSLGDTILHLKEGVPFQLV